MDNVFAFGALGDQLAGGLQSLGGDVVRFETFGLGDHAREERGRDFFVDESWLDCFDEVVTDFAARARGEVNRVDLAVVFVFRCVVDVDDGRAEEEVRILGVEVRAGLVVWGSRCR